jgi:broad specificity phosphatase PhoE
MHKKLKVILSILTFAILLLTVFNTSKPINSIENVNKNGEVVFYVTRHGKTMFNTVQRAQGWSDTPLTQEGVQIAEQLGRGLHKKNIHFTSVYSSDAGRARETANLVLKNNGQSHLKVQESKKFREFCFGFYEGEYDKVMWGDVGKELGYSSYEEYMKALGSGEASIPQALDTLKQIDQLGMAEDLETVKQRMQNELKTVAKKTAKAGGGNVLIVSHGMSILAMISDMTDNEPEGGQLANSSVTKITYKNGEFEVNEVGNMDYVECGAS